MPDHAERKECWTPGVRMFAAGTLALAEPRHELLDRERELWTEIAERTSASGQYDPVAELVAHSRLTGITKGVGCLCIPNRYALATLVSQPNLLSGYSEEALVQWISQVSVGYIDAPFLPPERASAGTLGRCLHLHELMTRFASWRNNMGSAFEEQLWLLRNEAGSGIPLRAPKGSRCSLRTGEERTDANTTGRLVYWSSCMLKPAWGGSEECRWVSSRMKGADMLRSLMQVYVKGSAEAVQLYQKAFGAELMCEYRNDDGSYMHAELDVFGQVLALSESGGEESITGNTMQFCLHFGEVDKDLVERAFGVLEQDAQIVVPLGPCSFSSCMVCLIDKFGVSWCLFA